MRRLTSLVSRVFLVAACGGFAYGFWLLAMQYMQLVLIPLGIAVMRRLRGGGGEAWSHGTARLATAYDALRGGMFSTDGVILGRADFRERPSLLAATLGLFWPKRRSELACNCFLAACLGPRWIDGRLIRLKRFVHLCTVAPAGAGKSVGVLVPNLLSYRGSVVVTDPKPELYRLTAEHRRRKLKHKILLLDPFAANGPQREVKPETHRFNPLDFISSREKDFLDSARDLASMLVVRPGDEKDPHWNDMATVFITAMIVFVCACETQKGRRNLNTVRHLISSRERFLMTAKVMQGVQGFDGVVARLGDMLTLPSDRELNSCLTTANRHLEFLDSPLIADHVSTTDFDPAIFRTGKATAYLTLPPDRLVSLAGLQRMWIGSLLRLQTRGDVGEANPVLWLLDEIGHLGRIQAVEDAVTLLRGKGIRLWFFVQSIEQIQKCYGDAAMVMLDNFGTKQFFGTTSFDTADHISKCIGDTTISVVSTSTTASTSKTYGGSSGEASLNRSTSTGSNWSDTGRRLIMPSEVLTLPETHQLIFTRNMPVICCRLLRYFADAEFRGGGTGTQRGLSLAACGMSLMLMMLGFCFAAFATDQTQPAVFQDGFAWPEMPGHLPAVSFDWASWLPARKAVTDPELTADVTYAEVAKAESNVWRVTEAAYQLAEIKRNASNELRLTGVPVPPHLTPRAIEAERVAAILAAKLEAQRKRQAYDRKPHPARVTF